VLEVSMIVRRQVRTYRYVFLNPFGDQASGPDGFTTFFFLKCWEVLKVDIMAFLKEFHNHGKFEKSLNATFISFILMTAREAEINDFHPISLIGGVYKIISKVLANRLKSILGKIDIFKRLFFGVVLEMRPNFI
jgi:hypothetical protein